jgi:hypothetical protein
MASGRRAWDNRVVRRLLALVIVLGACAHGPGPDAALDAYGRALKNHDYAAAYKLMSADYQNKVKPDDYVRMMKDNNREVEETADRLRGKHSGLEVSADVEYGLGDHLRLVQEDGKWRIGSNPLDYYDQSSPQSALRSFVRAYRLERWDVMLRFVPNAYREKMDVAKMKGQFTGASKDKMDVLMNTLEQNVTEVPLERGNGATLKYGDNNEVKFIKEDGAWKLKDLD